ncbi:acetyl-CoA synthetase-like protein [Gymnopus androsaceus JB14]|uniref:Acetyl-CoA synthetase-like protein n=1 Tax=Gymnopus androsaceus JB14 TaxID=1447944 RepID=A0A6A4GCU2_9AGAR|nr:acetyl-CoA synthetase-like protein [Gymnopus androsaceus JB14]
MEKRVATLPLTHIYALFYNIFVALYVGIEVIIMNKFTLHEFTANIHSFRATACHIVPPIAVKLAKEIGSNIHDFPSLREWRSSAAPLGRDLTKSLQLQWRVPVQGLYGMTETTAVIALTDRGNLTNPSGAVGRLAPNLEAKTVDGELCLKGPNITIGYHNRPEANAATFDAEGYMHTGDIVQVDDEGFIYVVDRMKELIKYNGFQVAPAEIEDHLLHHELIQDAAVVGVNNFSRSTELPLAFVVPLSGSVGHGECSAEEMANIIMEYLAARVSPHKKLRGGIIFVTAIPKSPSGKIMRRQLKDYANGKKESLPELKVLRFGAPVPPL